MFKGLHQILHKVAPAPTESIKHPQANLIHSAKDLLASTKRQQHLKNIKALLNLPPKLYDTLYYKAIERFAEFVQELPETRHGIFANNGGFLDHSIERASRALGLCLAYFFPEEKTFQSVTSQQALWVYTVFTAALLLDVGKIAVKYDITLCNKDGSTIKTWLPYSGALTTQGKFYKYSFIKENRDNLRRLVTGLLARQLLSEPTDSTGGASGGTTAGGFNWIASNHDVLEAWLSILRGEGRPIGAFLTVIPLADAQTIENYINNHNKLGYNTEETVLPNVDKGKEFLQWLQVGLHDDSISINQLDSFVHMTPDGIVILDGAYKKFSQATNYTIPAEGIEREFRQLIELYQGSLGDIGQRYSAIGGFSAQRLESILIILNPALLFPIGKKMPANYSNFIVNNNATAINIPPPPMEPRKAQPHEYLRPR